MRTNTIEAFRGKSLQEVFSENQRKITAQIRALKIDYMLKLNEENFINDIVRQFTLDIPKVRDDEMTNEPATIENPRFDRLFNRRQLLPTIIYTLPFRGDRSFFQVNPTSTISGGVEITLAYDHLTFEIVDDGNKEQIKEQKQRIVDTLKREIGNIEKEVEGYHAQLPNYVRQVFNAHKQQLIEERKRLDELL